MKKGIDELRDIIYEGSDDLIGDIIYENSSWYGDVIVGNDFDGI